MNQNTPRNPFMAALMSLILPGFGQLYNGTVNRGLLTFMAFIAVTVPLVLWITWILPTLMTLPLLILTVIITVGIWVYAIVDAWKTAKKSHNYQLKSWQLPSIYLLIFLSAMFFFVPSMEQYVRANLVQSFNVPSKSMQPSILNGDVLFANKNYNCQGCAEAVKRGDVAIFVYPNNRTQYFIKRIVALPGDRVSIQNQQVYVNGESLIRGALRQKAQHNVITEGHYNNNEYEVQWRSGDSSSLEEFVVPNGEVYVLGDNRSNSKDSRHFGTVPLRDVVGKASQIWVSRGEHGFRWERFGLVVK